MTKDARQPEDIVKARLRTQLDPFFRYREEVKGIGPAGQGVVADFWLMPRASLITAGWTPTPIVLEVKGYDLADHRKRTAIRVVYQAASYSISTFAKTNGERVRPGMVLLHPPLGAFLGLSDDINNQVTFEGGLVYGLSRIGAMFNVGELSIEDGWFSIRMHGGTFYDSSRGFNSSNKLARNRDAASR